MNEALAAAWLQELWPTCREVSREERAVERARHAVDTPSNARAKAQVNGYSGGTTKAGRAGVDAPDLPALTPEQARATT